jgi:hypothetical protein
MNHPFTVQVSGIDPTGNYEDRLFEAGCNDALMAVVGGALYLDFDRDAASFDAALQSAQQDIERAGGHVEAVMPPAGCSTIDRRKFIPL